MARKNQIVVTREGLGFTAVMILILVAAMLRDINLLIILFGMMLGLLVFSWRYLAVAFRGLQVERRLPRSIGAGDLLDVEIEVSNRRRSETAWMISVEDRIQRLGVGKDVSVLKASVVLPRVVAGGHARASYRCRLVERGKYRFGPLRMSTGFPLGLLRRHTAIDQNATVTVYPRLGRLVQGAMQIQREAQQASRQRHRRQGHLEGDYHGLRDWRAGDSQRWIHWRTTARKGELMVRQFEQHTSQDLALVVELRSGRQSGPEQWENVELAVSFAATLLSDRCRRGGSQLHLATAGRETTLSRGPTSMAFLQDAMENLAMAQEGPEDHLAELLPRVLAEVRPGCQVILIGTQPVDLADTERFVTLWDEPRLRPWISRIRMFDTSSESLADYFVAQ